MTDREPVLEIAVDEIPVIDIGPLDGGTDEVFERVGAELYQAATAIGFFYIGNHGLAEGLIARAFAASREFFSQPDEAKAEVEVSGRHRGWLAMGQAKMVGYDQPDLKESFLWGLQVEPDDPVVIDPGSMIGPNLWPAAMPKMSTTLNDYFSATHDIGRLMFGAFAAALGAPRDAFTKYYDRPISRASLIHYPIQPVRTDDRFGVSPHTDYGCMTILAQDDVGGLEVVGADGTWLTAHPIAGTLVVNVGDLLTRWTNDLFASTRHRVVNRTGHERFSIAVAIDPDGDTLIDPICAPGRAPHYPPIACADYIRGRFDQSFAYRRKSSDR